MTEPIVDNALLDERSDEPESDYAYADWTTTLEALAIAGVELT